MLRQVLGAMRPRVPLLDDTGPVAQLVSWPRLQTASASAVFIALVLDNDIVHGVPSRTTSARTSDLLQQAIGGNLAAIMLALILLLVFQRRLFDLLLAVIGTSLGAASVWLTGGATALALYAFWMLTFYVLAWLVESLARLFLVAPLLRTALILVCLFGLGVSLNHNVSP